MFSDVRQDLFNITIQNALSSGARLRVIAIDCRSVLHAARTQEPWLSILHCIPFIIKASKSLPARVLRGRASACFGITIAHGEVTWTICVLVATTADVNLCTCTHESACATIARRYRRLTNLCAYLTDLRTCLRSRRLIRVRQLTLKHVTTYTPFAVESSASTTFLQARTRFFVYETSFSFLSGCIPSTRK